MPLLREFNDPEFLSCDFVTQILEGMQFMHRKVVAHSCQVCLLYASRLTFSRFIDVTSISIMTDASSTVPHGWRFIHNKFALNGRELVLTTASDTTSSAIAALSDFSSVRVQSSPVLKDATTTLQNWGSKIPYWYVALASYDESPLCVGKTHQKYLGLRFKFMLTLDFLTRPTALLAL
ncbi:hypothetical protein Hypma_003339 [Hypsizygus marmoreus]|uniref:Uncharacterized protein n=1 Tax=Hypsizygus marmoreus TaxID=39966 RepID=A0A369JBC5_HYPMA|nr:hypothetical protein Hypma_003339 [Hypsizygus marmoreus]